MVGVIRFIGLLVVGGFLLGLVSIVWPTLTMTARPPFLQKVYDTFTSLPIGQTIASAFPTPSLSRGPVNIGTVLGEAVSRIADDARGRVTQGLTQQATSYITDQFHHLPQKEKEQIQEIICQPVPKQDIQNQ